MKSNAEAASKRNLQYYLNKIEIKKQQQYNNAKSKPSQAKPS